MRYLICSIALSIAACGGVPQPKISEVETTWNFSGSTSVTRSEIDYVDNRIDRITYFEDGIEDRFMEFFYSGSDVETIERHRAGAVSTWDFEYKDDRVSTLHIVDSDETVDAAFEYDDDRVSRVKVTGIEAGVAQTFTIRFSYDGDHRLERITQESDGESEITEIDYDEDGRVDKITEIDNENDVYDYAYNEDGRVRRVSRTSGIRTSRHEVDYVDGKVDEIERIEEGLTRTTSYRYGDGDMDGVVPSPNWPHPMHFDIEGKSMDEPESRSFFFFEI